MSSTNGYLYATSHRDVTETSAGRPLDAFASAYAAGEKYGRHSMALIDITSPVLGEGVEVPGMVAPDGHVDALIGLLSSPLVAPVVHVTAPESLIAYAQRFATEHTVLFVEDVPSPRLTLVIDYHAATAEDGTPGAYAWARRRAVYEPVLTSEWQTWTTQSGKRVPQVDFAQFLEDNLPDIATPAGADILQIARTLEVKKGVNFRSSVRLDNGETQLLYEEVIQGSAAKGQFQIPDRLLLGLQPFKGAAKYEVAARFRYRLAESQLRLGVDLERVHKVLDAAVKDMLVDVVAKLPTIPVFHGPAPAIPSSDSIRLR